MKTKIILEMCCNHNGEIGTAKKMIDEAKQLDVWGVKFQKRDIDSMPQYLQEMPKEGPDAFGKTYEEHRRSLEFSIDQLKDLKEYAEERGIVFLITCFDERSINDMLAIKVKYIKFPSQKFSDYRLNNYIFEYKENYDLDDSINVCVSTGMHTSREIDTWPYLKKYEIVFYCRSMYPFPPEKGNMINIKTLKEKVCQVGYSSHDKNGILIPYAVILGAEYIERHYTLNKNMKGRDHKISSDFKEMQQIIRKVEYVESILGEEISELDPEEKKYRELYRGYY